jgi:hypothetical protein
VIVPIKNIIMKNVDIEIYISNLISFFENNPNDLMDLIGQSQKDEFFQKLRERSELNYKEGNDFVLTKAQIMDIVLELKMPDMVSDKKIDITNIIQKTKFGDIILN